MPKISLTNEHVPFFSGGAGSLAIETGEIALQKPIAADGTALLQVTFDGASGPITLGHADSMKLAFEAGGALELIPIVAASPAGVVRRLEACRLSSFFSGPDPDGRGLLYFRAAGSGGASARVPLTYSTLKTTATLQAGGDVSYTFVRPFAPSATLVDAVTGFFKEMRLPDQGARPPEPGEAVLLEFGGYLRLGAEASAGYELAGTKSFALGQLALSERYDLSIVGRIGLSAGVAGRYTLLVIAADRPGWARVVVTRSAEQDLKVAADVIVGFKNELDLPGSAHEFIGAALGVNGKNAINLFNRALELSDFDAFRLATDGLAKKIVEAVIGRGFDALSSRTEFDEFIATVGRVVDSYEKVEDRAVALFDRYFDRLTPLTAFLEELQTLTADRLASLRGRLDPERWAILSQLTDGDPLAFLLDQVDIEGRVQSSLAALQERAGRALDLIRGRAHEELRRVLTLVRQQFGIDQFFRGLATIDSPDELRAVANDSLGLFVTRLVGRQLDSSANIKAAFKEVRAVLANVDAFSNRLFTAFKEASNSSYRTALHAEYSRASATDALIDVQINLGDERGVALFRQAGRGDFEQVLTTTNTDVVMLGEGVFTHHTRRRRPFAVNIVGWHHDYKYEGFDQVISETEQRLVPSESGITIYTTTSLQIERQRKRHQETVHVNFLLRALGESAGVLKSHAGDRAYVVDALSSLAARYSLALTDDDTSEMELHDYLAFAADLGLAAKGATLAHLTPLMPRAANGGFGAVSAEYDIRFGKAAIDALLSVNGISTAGEAAIRRGLRQIVLANYLKSAELHDVAFAYATPGIFALFAEEGAAQFTSRSQRAFNIAVAGPAIAAPAAVTLDRLELNVLATLYNIENSLIASIEQLYAILNGGPIDLERFEKALAGFGDAMALFDDFDQTSRKGPVGTNTLFVVFDQLVRLASHGAPATAAVLRLTSRVGDRQVEKLFLSDDAAAR